jgi:hypothetical protein
MIVPRNGSVLLERCDSTLQYTCQTDQSRTRPAGQTLSCSDGTACTGTLLHEPFRLEHSFENPIFSLLSGGLSSRVDKLPLDLVPPSLEPRRHRRWRGVWL